MDNFVNKQRIDRFVYTNILFDDRFDNETNIINIIFIKTYYREITISSFFS